MEQDSLWIKVLATRYTTVKGTMSDGGWLGLVMTYHHTFFFLYNFSHFSYDLTQIRGVL